jgi:hypothetical protein
VAIALDDTDSWENCRDVAIGPNELVTLADVRVRLGPGGGTLATGGLS